MAEARTVIALGGCRRLWLCVIMGRRILIVGPHCTQAGGALSINSGSVPERGPISFLIDTETAFFPVKNGGGGIIAKK